MNNNIYTQPSYIPSQNTLPNYIPSQGTAPPIITQNSGYSREEYAANLLKNNIGKRAAFYVSFSDSIQWRDSIFEGIIEDAGKDFVVIYNQESGKRYLLWNVYLDYIVFDQQLN